MSSPQHTTQRTRLPTELVEHILSMLWTSTLSVQDQRTLLTSVPLVSHAWNVSFQVIQRLFPTPKELHIVSQRHAVEFISLLRNGGSTDSRLKSKSPKPNSFPPLNELKSISMIIPAPRITPFDPHSFPHSPPMCIAFSELLRALSDCPNRLPALRTLRVDFWNVPLDEAVGYAQLRFWPDWVREVQFSFGVEDGTEDEGGLRGGAELKRCGGRGAGGDVDVDGYGYCNQLSEMSRSVLGGVKNVTLVDAGEEVVMYVKGAFLGAKVVSV